MIHHDVSVKVPAYWLSTEYKAKMIYNSWCSCYWLHTEYGIKMESKWFIVTLHLMHVWKFQIWKSDDFLFATMNVMYFADLPQSLNKNYSERNLMPEKWISGAKRKLSGIKSKWFWFIEHGGGVKDWENSVKKSLRFFICT